MQAYQPPPPPPPAIVEKVTWHLVQLPINIVTEKDRAIAAAQLALCANLTSRHMGRTAEESKKVSSMDAHHCLAVVQNAVRNGTISDFPAITLALRSIPFTDSKGGDNVARVMDDMASRVAAFPEDLGFDYFIRGLDPSQFVQTSFTVEAIHAVTIREGHSVVLPEMTPFHSIPIDPSTAYVITAADVVAHPARYTSEGMTLAQTIAGARTRHSVADDAKITKSCFDNDGTQGIHECQQVAARDTAEMIVKGQFKAYDPELYSPARVAETAPEYLHCTKNGDCVVTK